LPVLSEVTGLGEGVVVLDHLEELTEVESRSLSSP
jgi:hypothetical protein